MKIDFNRKYNTIAVYVIIVLLLGAVGVVAVLHYKAIGGWIKNLADILGPFIGGFAIAYIINPVLNFYERLLKKLFTKNPRPKLCRVLALIGAYITAFFIIALFLWFVIPQLRDSVLGLAAQIEAWLPQLEATIHNIMVTYDLERFLGFTTEQDLLQKVLSAMENFADDLTDTATTAITFVAQTAVSLVGLAIDTVVALLISVYLLYGKETFIAQFKKIGTAFLSDDSLKLVRRVVLRSHQIFSGFISGKILDSAIIGVLCFITMSIFKWPYAMLISVIVGITNVIPFFGPFIGAIPSILIMAIVSPKLALLLALMILVLQQLDGNVIGPKILGDSIGMPPLWVIFAITFFGGAWGLLGMFIGVPTFAVIYYIIQELSAWKLKKKGRPTETAAYVSGRTTLDSAKAEHGDRSARKSRSSAKQQPASEEAKPETENDET